MDRGDILSGAAFTAVLRASIVFVAVLVAMAFFSIRLLERVMTEQVQLRVLEMAESLTQAAEGEGSADLAERIDTITRIAAGQTLAYALLDADGTRLVGNTDVAPEHGEWLTIPVRLDRPSHRAGDPAEQDFLMHAIPVDDMTLVVGESMKLVTDARRTVIRGFALTGFIVVVAMLAIGYALSRRSQTALQNMEAALDAVSRGETGARIVLSARGNTQIDRIARRVNGHLAELEALFAQTRRTAASVAHDLRRPLARATLGIERALARLEAGDDARGDVEQALADLAHLKAIIASILRIARIESGEVGVMRTFDLREVLDEVAETFEPVAEDAGQRLSYDRASAPLTVDGDPEMLGQLVVNLVQNAITHAGGGASIRLDANEAADGLVLTVTDTGPGVPEGMRDKVFQPFFRTDPSRTIEGSGLGLPLVKAIADRHDATVELSDAGPGLRVQVTFPAPSPAKIANS